MSASSSTIASQSTNASTITSGVAELKHIDKSRVLQVKRLSKTAVLPQRAEAGSAGYDLASAHDCVVSAYGKLIVPTDLAITVPFGTYGRIAPRSGLAWKSHIDVGAGVIDRSYTSNVGIVLFNHAETDLKIAAGDRVAQLILEKCMIADVMEVDELEKTNRTGGFGSTGMSTLPTTSPM